MAHSCLYRALDFPYAMKLITAKTRVSELLLHGIGQLRVKTLHRETVVRHIDFLLADDILVAPVRIAIEDERYVSGILIFVSDQRGVVRVGRQATHATLSGKV